MDKKALNRLNDILTEYGTDEFNRHWMMENHVEYPEDKQKEDFIYDYGA